MSASRPVIFAVDDDPAVLGLLQAWLTPAEFEFTPFHEPGRAVAAAREARPNLILLDVMMPGLDGYELCRRMRDDAALAFVPCVFLTALGGTEDRRRAFAAGGVDFLSKPLRRETLLAAIRKQLATDGRWAGIKAGSEAGPPLATPSRFEDFKTRLIERYSPRTGDRDRLQRLGCERLYDAAGLIGAAPSELARFCADFLGWDFLPDIPADDIPLGLLPAAFCRANSLVALGPPGRRRLAVSNPFCQSGLELARLALQAEGALSEAVSPPGTIASLFSPEPAVTPPAAAAAFPPAAAILDELLRRAVSAGASDIHLEPKADGVLVRLRVDGAMQEAETLSRATGSRAVARLKALAGMDIAERRKSQDGSFDIDVAGRGFKLRMATAATPEGESLVLRLLEPQQKPRSPQELGLTPDQARRLAGYAGRKSGLILVVGSTGSGKSTTVYSLLSNVDCAARSLMTVEDPVEYRIPRAMQQQVNEKAGVTFESLLKIAMRQDPDVIFLGEIRDAVSAKAALDLASTGHLTISTMHTTNAASAVFRLERLGVSRAVLAESLLCVVAQKLVRRLCPRCAREAPATEAERRLLVPFGAAPLERVFRPEGCPACGRAGYSGREAVCEIMDCDPPVAEKIRAGASIAAIRAFIRERGDLTIVDHALDKVRRGIASLREVYENVVIEELDLYSRGRGAAEPPPAGAAAPGGRRAILVVDDDANARELLRAHLQGAGCEVACAEDGIRALLELGSRRFDLVLSDMNMPNLGGMKLLEMVQQKGFPTPVLLMTADSGAGVEEECLRHGAADFIRKPIDKEVLLLRVRRALSVQGS